MVLCEEAPAPAPAASESVSKSPFPEGFEFANVLGIGKQEEQEEKEVIQPIEPNKKPYFSTNWERSVAYHYGLYMPEMYFQPKTADEIKATVAKYAETVHQDAPKDACKYLQIEEFRCLHTNHFETQPQVASKKCMKWWDEMQKCQWDQVKFNNGTTYIEGPQMRRRRAYIFYPDFKYA